MSLSRRAAPATSQATSGLLEAALSGERLARRALQVARRTALGVLGDTEAAADIAREVASTAVRRADSLRDPAALGERP